MGGRFNDYLASDAYRANADRAIKAFFRKHHPAHRDLEWTELDGITEAQMARAMGGDSRVSDNEIKWLEGGLASLGERAGQEPR
jgi:hypothetical protein